MCPASSDEASPTLFAGILGLHKGTIWLAKPFTLNT